MGEKAKYHRNHCSIDALRDRQRRTLQSVLGINAVMFLVIVGAALYGHSTALLADSLDNLGDALTYGLSLYAVARGAAVKAKVALFKGGLFSSPRALWRPRLPPGCLSPASPLLLRRIGHLDAVHQVPWASCRRGTG